MPEALAVAAVFFVAIGVYVFARLEARNPALIDHERDLARLRHQAVWLEERLHRARRENWDGDMVENLATELATTTEKLAHTHTSPRR